MTTMLKENVETKRNKGRQQDFYIKKFSALCGLKFDNPSREQEDFSTQKILTDKW